MKEFSAIRGLLKKRTGIALDANQDYLIETRLAPIAERAGFRSVVELDRSLSGAPQANLTLSVIEALTTHETSFFRDTTPFELLRNKVLPQLLETRRATRSLRIWSAACSTGQEPYSIAMLLDAEFPQFSTWQVSILATDISNAVLNSAKRGEYHPFEVGRGLPKRYQEKYFVQSGDRWSIAQTLRSRVTFRQANLLDSLPSLFPMFDIVFCRNVLIYFEQSTREAVLLRIRKHLAADGLLFVGSAETSVTHNGPFQRSEFGLAGCYTPKAG